MSKTISAVVPNYNHQRYLPFSLEAICSQSVAPKEVFVVDDASTDGSLEVVREFQKRHPFIRLIRNEKNSGVNASLKRGFEECTADYVCFPAADDLLLPGLFEKSLALLEKHPQAGVCSALVGILSPEGEDLGLYETAVISKEPCYVPPERYVETYREHDNWIITYPAVFRREAVAALGGHDAALGPPADSVLIRELAMTYGSCFIPERLGMWRPPRSGGYGQTYSQDFDAALKIHDRVIDRLLHPEGRAPTADELEFLRIWRRRIGIEHLYYLLQEKPYPAQKIATVLDRIPDLGAGGRILAALLRASPIPPKRLVKLFHVMAQRPEERRRIVKRKLGLA